MLQHQLRLFTLLVLASASHSFPTNNANKFIPPKRTCLQAVKGKSKSKGDQEVSFLLEDFQTASGSLVDPYKILKIKRTATKVEIKESYRKLSRKLHPDMVANREILPGNCANLDEVREEWEKVKLSYEILTDKKMRQKYDRHSAVADPGGAMGRMAMNAVGWGLTSVGQGFWKMGEQVVKAANVEGGREKSEVVGESVQEGSAQS